MQRIDPDQSLLMEPSHIRSVLAAGAVALSLLFPATPVAAVDVPLPEEELPALRALVESALSRSPRAIARELELLSAEYATLVSSSPLYPRVDGSFDFQIRNEEIPRRSVAPSPVGDEIPCASARCCA
jgi:outer membrane protein TolC